MWQFHDRRPPPQRRPFTDSLVRPFAGPSYKPSSDTTDPPHRKHYTTRPPKPSSTAPDLLHGRHIQLHRPCFTDAAASSGYFDLYSFRFFSLSCNCSLTTDELSCMSTGAATVAPEPLQRRRQPAQTQPQHEHHRRSLAIKYDNDTHTPPRIRYYYPTAGAYVHFPSISTAPLNFFMASFSFSWDALFCLHL